MSLFQNPKTQVYHDPAIKEASRNVKEASSLLFACSCFKDWSGKSSTKQHAKALGEDIK
jgi:hypothetical protein